MNRLLRRCIVVTAAALASSCGLFDSGIEWRGGPYALLWIDTDDSMAICRDIGDDHLIGRIDSTVYAVGWDGRYLVAKQHPNGDRNITRYFVLDSTRDADLADPDASVTGPLTAAEFGRMAAERRLPPFTKVLGSLE